MTVPCCKDCTERYKACHDTCEKFKAWKAEAAAEQEYTKRMNDSGRCVPYDHYKDIRSRRTSGNKPKTYWADK